MHRIFRPHYSDAYYTEEQASSGRKKWLQALMSSLNNYTLKCTATSMQINGYLMKKYEQYFAVGEDQKVAVRATGLQTTVTMEETQIWVLNENVQYDEKGELVNIQSSPYTYG